MADKDRRFEDKELITPTRVLTIENNLNNLSAHVGELKETIEANELKSETFQRAVLEKLDEKSDFNLQSTMKTVVTTIVIVGAAVAALDYRMDSKLSVPISDGLHRDKALIILQKNGSILAKKMAKLEITMNNAQKEVDGNSAFVDYYQYTEKVPSQINNIISDTKMLQYRITKLEGN